MNAQTSGDFLCSREATGFHPDQSFPKNYVLYPLQVPSCPAPHHPIHGFKMLSPNRNPFGLRFQTII